MISIRNKLKIVLIFAGTWLTCAQLLAAGNCCDKCGCQTNVQCVCRPVQTTKYIEITCWDSFNEEKCLPPRSRCGECCPTESAAGCKVKTINKLVRKTYLKPVPTVIWVVESLCDHCRCASEPSAASQQRPLQEKTTPESAFPADRQSSQESLPTVPRPTPAFVPPTPLATAPAQAYGNRDRAVILEMRGVP